MRPRRRYLAVRILTRAGFPSEPSFRNAIWQQLKELYGELGVSRIGFWLIAFHPASRSAIIRCQHDQVRPLRAALATITSIDSTPLILRVVGISGTIRKAVSLLPELEAQRVVKSRRRR